MKYSSLTPKKEKLLHIPAANGGVNFSIANTEITINQMSDCKNVFEEKGLIKTRPALECNPQSVVTLSELSGMNGVTYDVKSEELYINGEYKKIVTMSVDYGVSNYFVYIYLMAADSSLKAIGSMHFQRADDNTFFCPMAISFYKGAPVKGGGIFALVTLENRMKSGEYDYKIFEVNADFNAWNRSYSFYIPTVYINGRGNNYSDKAVNNVINELEPRTLEGLNMLSGSFYAYYSSDGYSNLFRLPFADLADSPISLRVHYNLDSYTEWNIAAGENSDTQKFFNSDITLFVDRKKGTVFFKNGETDYSVPAMSMYRENNIRVLAEKEIPNALAEIAEARSTINVDGKIVLAGGINGNKLYFADYENPLYFPFITDNTVGNCADGITAFTMQNGELYAFKKNEIYNISIKRGKTVNTTALLTDNGNLFKSPDTVISDCIENAVGCPFAESIASLNGKAIWQAGDKKIYMLSGSKVTALSGSVDCFISKEFNLSTSFGGVYCENYILCSGNKAVIMNCSGNKASWYIWNFPDSIEVKGLFGKGENLSLICQNLQNKICYIAKLCGNEDVILKDFGIVEPHNIQSFIKTKRCTLGGLGKRIRINRIFLKLLSTGKTNIEVGCDNIVRKLTCENGNGGCHGEDEAELIVDINGAREVYLALESDKGISFGGADIYYF